MRLNPDLAPCAGLYLPFPTLTAADRGQFLGSSPAALLTSWMTLGGFPNLSVPSCPHLMGNK